MKIRKRVQGSSEKILTFEVTNTAVYIRSHITQGYNLFNLPCWYYDEKEYSLEEYLRDVVPNQQDNAEKAILELSEIIAMQAKRIADLEEKVGEDNV